jgi:OmpA family
MSYSPILAAHICAGTLGLLFGGHGIYRRRKPQSRAYCQAIQRGTVPGISRGFEPPATDSPLKFIAHPASQAETALQLSQRRAEAVRDFLVQTGISPTIMSTKGFGNSDPRVPGDSEQARATNRRVEIGIVNSKLITNGALVVPK